MVSTVSPCQAVRFWLLIASNFLSGIQKWQIAKNRNVAGFLYVDSQHFKIVCLSSMVYFRLVAFYLARVKIPILFFLSEKFVSCGSMT